MSRIRRAVATMLAALIVLTLAACDARVDTRLVIRADGTGERLSIITIDGEGLTAAEIAEDVALAEEYYTTLSVSEHEYRGHEVDARGRHVFTFALPFASAAEYGELVARFQIYEDPEDDGSDVADEDRLVGGTPLDYWSTPFVRGLIVDEPFTAVELMTPLSWPAYDHFGQRSYEVVPERTLGTTVIEWEGEEIAVGQRLEHSQLDDRGLSAVTMRTDLREAPFTRTVALALDDAGTYDANRALYDALLAEATSAGATVTRADVDGGVRWDVAFSAQTHDELARLTGLVVRAPGSTLAVEDELDPYQPMARQVVVSEFVECTQICSPSAPAIVDTVTLRPGLDLLSAGDSPEVSGDATTISTAFGAEEKLGSRFRGLERFAQASTVLTLDVAGSATWRVELTADGLHDAETQAAVAEKIVVPRGNRDSLVVTERDGHTLYTVTLEGSTVDELAAEARAWSGKVGAELSRQNEAGANPIIARYRLDAHMSLPDALVAHLPLAGTTHELRVPFGQDSAQAIDVVAAGDAARFTTVVTGPTLAGLALAAFAAAALLTAGAVLISRLISSRSVRAARLAPPARP